MHTSIHSFPFPIMESKLGKHTYLFSVKQIMTTPQSEITIGNIVVNTQTCDYVVRIIPSPYTSTLFESDETKLINSCLGFARELERSQIMDETSTVNL